MPILVFHFLLFPVHTVSALCKLADWSMEPQVWEPCNFQLADWSMEHAVWVPDILVSCESESTEMACLEETFAPSSSRGLQLVQYAAAATPNYDDPFGVFQRKAEELEVDNKNWENKMHRYPPSIRDLGKQYTVPRIVSIGPYHHGLDHLKKAEEAKHVAACNIIKDSGRSVQEMYDAVVSVAYKARSLYDKNMMAGIEDRDFLPMLFFDACFLVLLLRMYSSKTVQMNTGLFNFIISNHDDIYRDILLLENQLPWLVVEKILRFTPVSSMEVFLKGMKASLQDRKDHENKHFDMDDDYEPPHLLGLVRFYIVGTNKTELFQPHQKTKVISFSVSAIELAEIGITLTPSKTTEVAHMGIKKGCLSAELFLAPLSLMYQRASYLINMAAFEMVHSAPGVVHSEPRIVHEEDTAVCSYLQLLGMLVDREEDVQELRSKQILQGGGGLTNKETLDFFTSLQVVRTGTLYLRTIHEIEMYKQNRQIWVKVHAFFYKNTKTMLVVLSVIAALSGILGMLISALKKK